MNDENNTGINLGSDVVAGAEEEQGQDSGCSTQCFTTSEAGEQTKRQAEKWENEYARLRNIYDLDSKLLCRGYGVFCIYGVYFGDECLYAGKTTKPRKRSRAHLLRFAEKGLEITGVRIFALIRDPDKARLAEKRVIKKLDRLGQVRFNTTFTKRAGQARQAQIRAQKAKQGEK